MATLLDVRTDFVKTALRYDLINAGDFTSDNGADAFINKAQRFLDRSVIGPRTLRRFPKRLKIGDFFIAIDDLISIDTVLVKDSSDTENELADITKNVFSYQAFRQKYPGAISNWSSGQPSAWAPAPLLFAPEFTFAENLANGTFASDTLWAKTGNWAIASGVATASADDGNLTQAVADQAAALVVGRTYRVTFTIVSWTVGTVKVLVGAGGEGTERGEAGTFTEDIVCTTDTDFAFDGTGFTGTIDNVSCVDISLQADFIETKPIDIGDTLVELPAATTSRLTGIIFNPKADAAYTIEVIGRFYARALSADTDTSYWSVNYPDLLAITASWLAVRQHGSASRARYFLDLMQLDQLGINKEFVEFEMSGMDTKLEI